MSTTTDKTQRMIFLALPFVFVTFVIQFPAGLLVYWITTNIWTIVQQAIIRKRLGPLRPATAPGGEKPVQRCLTAFGERAGPPPSMRDGQVAATATRSRRLGSRRRRSEASRRAARRARRPSPPRKKKKRSGRRR